MKRIIALALCLIMALLMVSCSEEEEEKEPQEIYKVTGNTYKADVTTINVGKDEGENINTNAQRDFIANIKSWFGESKITFTSENSFSLTGTNNGMHDFVAEDCQRDDNELFKEIKLRGNVDVLVGKDKVSMYCDFFYKGWGWYISIDYTLVK